MIFAVMVLAMDSPLSKCHLSLMDEDLPVKALEGWGIIALPVWDSNRGSPPGVLTICRFRERLRTPLKRAVKDRWRQVSSRAGREGYPS